MKPIVVTKVSGTLKRETNKNYLNLNDWTSTRVIQERIPLDEINEFLRIEIVRKTEKNKRNVLKLRIS